MPVGAPSLRRGAAHGRRGLPRAQEGAARTPGYNTTVGDEGGFAPNLESADEALGFVMQAIETAGYKPGEDIDARPRRRLHRVLQGRQVRRSQGEGKIARIAGADGRSTWAELVGKYPIISIEDGWPRTTGTAGSCSPRARRARSSSSATTCSSPTPSVSPTASRRASANRILVKVNQIGTLTETLDAVELAQRSRLHRRHVATAPARPRTRPSPTSPSPPTAARSRPARCPAPTASPSTTSSSASRRSWATPPVLPARPWFGVKLLYYQWFSRACYSLKSFLIQSKVAARQSTPMKDLAVFS